MLETWATYAGKLQAKVWFAEEKYRLLELSTDRKMRFTGRKDGEFEVWTWTQHTNDGSFIQSLMIPEGDEGVFVEAYNDRMRELAARSRRETNSVARE